MKLLCDACSSSPSSLICCADEASLCSACDSRIHGANKLAEKHHRLPLLQPSSSDDLPRCDICQDKSGFFFCLEDRSLLCRNCDFSIHSSNSLASKHNRFLVTGIRVSLQHIDASENLQTSSPSHNKSTTSPLAHRKSAKVASSSSNAAISSTQILPNLNPNPYPPPVRENPKPENPRQWLAASAAADPASDAAESLLCVPPSSSSSSSKTIGKQNSIASNGNESYARMPSRQQPEKTSYAQSTDAAANSKSTNFGIQSFTSAASSYGAPCELCVVLDKKSSNHMQNHMHEEEAKNKGFETTNNETQPLLLHKVSTVGSMAPPAAATPANNSYYVRKGSIAEYLTETIPGWKVDDFFNLYGIETAQHMYSFDDCGSTREAAANSGDSSSPVTENIYFAGEEMAGQGGREVEAAAEVPKMQSEFLSTPTATGLERSSVAGMMKAWSSNYCNGKRGRRNSKRELEEKAMVAMGWDDTSVVPDVGDVWRWKVGGGGEASSLAAMAETPQRRKRFGHDYWQF